uniref:beta-N-acetylhexosaminidase n=1 Tax=Scylla olivacea TaxID=85551 RepID=A0A0N7ZD94_SCYOL
MKLLLVALLVAVAAAQSHFRLPAPYTFNCRSNKCIKEERSGSREFRSLESCQLTCGTYGSLWPQPTGDVQLGSQTVTFSPKNIQVTKMAATSPKVTQMLEDAVNHFTRNLHFIHPEYPKEKKTPVVYKENYRKEEPSVDVYEVIERERLRSEQIAEESILQQQQEQSRPYSTINEKTRKYLKYSPFLRERSTPAAENHNFNIDITVTSPEDQLTLDTDESYTLVVQTARSETTATIVATTYYGARHGLESLSQLIAFDDSNNALQIVNNAKIHDEPQFKYRGLMLDTGRNFYPKEDIMQLMDAMSQNKMNYFHWHISDSASFPMYSSRRPEMAYYGAYSPREVYYPEDITEIVNYAKLRGIKVIPEMNGPAHTNAGWQWGEKEGLGKLVLCTDNTKPWFEIGKEPPTGQVNPINPELYSVLEELYRDMMDYFDPEMVHMGGDDVSFKCWQNSEEIKEYLAANGREAVSQEFFELWNTYQQNAYSKLREASGPYRSVTPIIHASSYALNYADKDSYVVQLNMDANDEEMIKYINQGFKVIFSNQDQWRLDCIGNNFYGEKAESCKTEIPTWRSFYDNSPLDMLENLGVSSARSGQLRSGQVNPIKEQVLGGEATLWSFDTDANGFQAKAWPRVAALAERLWTDPIPNHGEDTSAKRINIHRKRMVDLGVRADPIQPQYCMQDETACYSKEQYHARSASLTANPGNPDHQQQQQHS